MTRLITVLLILIGHSAFSQTSDPIFVFQDGTLESKTLNFSVNFPQSPEYLMTVSKVGNADINEHKFRYIENNYSIFILTASVLPKGQFDISAKKQIIEALYQQGRRPMGDAILTVSDTIENENYYEYKFELRSKDKSVDGRMNGRLIVANDIVYQIVYSGTSLGNATIEKQKFPQSFELLTD